MFWTIIIGILVLLSVLVLAMAGTRTIDGETITVSRKWAFLPLALALIVAAFACTAQVNAREEGVITSFGHVSDRTLSPGLSVKAPWQKVTAIDYTNKTDKFIGGSTKDANTVAHGPLHVRLGDGNTADAYVTVRWSATPGKANDIYSKYRGTDIVDQMRDNLLIPNLQQAANDVLGTYSPTQAIDDLDIDFTDPAAIAKALKDIKINPDFEADTTAIQGLLEQKLQQNGDLIKIEQVTFSYLTLPKVSQDRIAAFLTEVNNTRIALQHQATNTAQATANDKLSASLDQHPNVLVSECLDLIRSGELTPPPGFSCWAGGGSAVVIPSTSK